MSRVKGGPTTRQRRKKVLKRAEGFWGSTHVRYRIAREAVMKALQHAYVGRRLKKRDFRTLWIQRINAACRQEGLAYNQFIFGLKQAGVVIDRKVLADIAVNDPNSFSQLVEIAKGELNKQG
ncbi:MAG: 50S ribosomal protein L20 [Caldiserica bacterium]|nr:50S ribosomal protein L20 [Caldisericota bacterium]MDH7562630.1 50S ribosomal protein L20 [Caldisericota bacterium]